MRSGDVYRRVHASYVYFSARFNCPVRSCGLVRHIRPWVFHPAPLQSRSCRFTLHERRATDLSESPNPFPCPGLFSPLGTAVYDRRELWRCRT